MDRTHGGQQHDQRATCQVKRTFHETAPFDGPFMRGLRVAGRALKAAYTTRRGFMKIAFARALALVLLSLTLTAPALAATKPKPNPLPTPQLPTKKLHTEFVVEVNAKGQVVRVKSGKDSVDTLYNAHTYGDVLQMWIRHPDGTAVVGLYRVTFDYNPKNHMIARHVSLVKA